MTAESLTLPTGRGSVRELSLVEFAGTLTRTQADIGFRLSSRGWCYQLEGFRLINKNQFNLVENLINECRTKGYLPIDFTGEEEARGFSGVEIPDDDEPKDFIKRYLEAILEVERYYTPDWWDGEDYYIQMVVEKIDLKTLFEPVCQQYHIPIATSKGWSSMLQRATYAKRFREAEELGLECVLLYCGDHDPDGLRISEFLRSNLEALKDIHWEDGTGGYDPEDLIIKRFGLNFDFIEEHHLTWIDNLITGSGRNLADPHHTNFRQAYVQEYLSSIGERKCEANALVINRQAAEALCRDAIEEYLGPDARARFQKKTEEVRERFDTYREETGLGDVIKKVIEHG